MRGIDRAVVTVGVTLKVQFVAKHCTDVRANRHRRRCCCWRWRFDASAGDKACHVACSLTYLIAGAGGFEGRWGSFVEGGTRIVSSFFGFVCLFAPSFSRLYLVCRIDATLSGFVSAGLSFSSSSFL